jgi:hypothetical protein
MEAPCYLETFEFEIKSFIDPFDDVSDPVSLGDSLQPSTPAIWQTQSDGTGSAVASVQEQQQQQQQQQQQPRRSQQPRACHASAKATARRYSSSKDTQMSGYKRNRIAIKRLEKEASNN